MAKHPVVATQATELEMPTGMIRRGARYALRRRVPLDLVAHYGRKEITKGLATSDLKEAKRRLHIEWAALDREFERARQPAPAAAAPPRVAYISPTSIAIWNMDRLRDDRDEAARSGTYAAFMQEQREKLVLIQAMLGGSVDQTHSPRELEGMRNGLKAFLESDGALALAAARRPPPAPQAEPLSPLPLTDLWKRWREERQPDPRTAERARREIIHLTAVTGVSDATALRRPHLISFRDTLIQEGSTPENVNSILNLIKTVLARAKDSGLISENVASGVAAKANKRARGKRRAFTSTELNSLFSSPVYANGERPKGGGGEAAYWLPLIGLYTGARLNEIGQLYCDDLRQEQFAKADGSNHTAWTIRLVANEARGQKLKNEGSERRFPIHPVLIRLGILHYLVSNKGTLFPDIQPSALGERTANWSKWFSRYRKSIPGLGGSDTPFHAFRHTFKHYGRLSNIAKDVNDEITGHSSGDVAGDYGGLSYPLAPLVEAMEAYTIPGLVLPEPWVAPK